MSEHLNINAQLWVVAEQLNDRGYVPPFSAALVADNGAMQLVRFDRGNWTANSASVKSLAGVGSLVGPIVMNLVDRRGKPAMFLLSAEHEPRFYNSLGLRETAGDPPGEGPPPATTEA